MKNMIIQGDAIKELKKLDEGSVDCMITSPPYFGLRDYGTAQWEGGDPNCEHLQPSGTTLGKKSKTFHGSNTQVAHDIQYKTICQKCGAKRIDIQLGLEETPELYVEKMVEVFKEIKRVLKKEGTAWLNLGDSYNTQPAGNKKPTGFQQKSSHGINGALGQQYGKNAKRRHLEGLKPKDLIGIPWRVALALQADGWYLRQDIIWHKPNPMPESVTDRCTKAHEYVFLLSKSKKYYFDHEAIKEDSTSDIRERTRLIGHGQEDADGTKGSAGNTGKRNKRSVWTINTKPFKEAHFAVFPEALIEPMILAGCPENGTVLDPFFGAGTTGLVAKKLGRKYIGIELNSEYCQIAEDRIKAVDENLFNS